MQKNSRQNAVKNETQGESMLDVAIQALEELKKERELRRNLEQQLAAQNGKVRFADAVTASGDSILVRELAGNLKQGGLNIGQKRLFEWLRQNGYLYRLESGHNMPTQKSLDLGIIEIQKRTRITTAGNISVERTPKITSKGQQYFFQLLMAEGSGK